MVQKRFVKPYRVDKPKRFRLADCDPADCGGLTYDKAEAKAELAEGVARLAELQERLYAQNEWALLVVFQAMDAAGKDGAIEHVFSGVNPQGCEVTSFKAPTAHELDHDFLWRCMLRLPARGMIGIFNRSYYEEVLVVRVHPGLLDRQRLPARLVTQAVWAERYEDIRAFERYLTRQGVVIVKFFLNVSKEEQKKRFLERLDQPEKHWKFAPQDVAERAHFDAYMDAYETMIRETSTDESPWYVVPADNKWFTRIVVADTLVKTLEKLDLAYPQPAASAEDMAAARAALESE
jgi:PPK2 family polyphosphate:nucleotide phosphotransferase